jgi:plastocyanin
MKMAILIVVSASLILSGNAMAEVAQVAQNHRAFHPKSLDIKVGDTVHIVNDDEFTHNVYVVSPDFNFDSDEQPPGNTQDITFTRAGDYEVHCHIHPKMLLLVHVQ